MSKTTWRALLLLTGGYLVGIVVGFAISRKAMTIEVFLPSFLVMLAAGFFIVKWFK